MEFVALLLKKKDGGNEKDATECVVLNSIDYGQARKEIVCLGLSMDVPMCDGQVDISNNLELQKIKKEFPFPPNPRPDVGVLLLLQCRKQTVDFINGFTPEEFGMFPDTDEGRAEMRKTAYRR